MLKLKLQYFGHLMRRANWFEKTLLLGKIEGKRRRGQQRMRWLNGITDSMDMSFTSPGIWWWTGRPGVLQSIESQRVRHNWATELKPSQWMFLKDSPDSIEYHYHVRSVGLYSQQVCVFVCAFTCTQSCLTLCNLWPTMCLCPWDFSRQEYWSGLPFPFPGDLPDPGIEPVSLVNLALARGIFTTSTTWECSPSLRVMGVVELQGVPLIFMFPSWVCSTSISSRLVPFWLQAALSFLSVNS